MKIKELFLTESVGQPPALVQLYYDLHGNTLSDYTEENLKFEMENFKGFQFNFVEIGNAIDYLSIRFNETLNCSGPVVDKAIKQITSIVRRLVKDDQIKTVKLHESYLLFNSMPTITIDSDIEIIIRLAKNDSLSNLTKIISSKCKNLAININEPVGILNVLRLNPNIKLDIRGLPTPVFKIVNKHLKGDKNVLNCQEELINAGLEEYAQL